jgi:beta-glucanase (GH16 family)
MPAEPALIADGENDTMPGTLAHCPTREEGAPMHRNRPGLPAAAILAAALAVVGEPAAGAETSGPPSADYKLAWSDEFEGKALDRTKWDYRQLGPRRKAINVKDTVALDGKGHLVLTTRLVGKDIHTAMIGTQGKYETVFGYFECRVKMQTSHGHWSAFWLQSPTLGKTIGDVKVSGTEIDIYECFRVRENWVSSNLHWDGYGKHHKHVGSGRIKVPDLTKGYHTFGLEWTPEAYTFYADGKKRWRSGKAVSHAKEYIILSLEVGPREERVVRKQADFSDSALFDYVRVYKKQGPARPPKAPASE